MKKWGIYDLVTNQIIFESCCRATIHRKLDELWLSGSHQLTIAIINES